MTKETFGSKLGRRIAGWARKCAASAVCTSLLLASGCRAQQWPLWSAYSAKYLDSQGRVIDHGASDHSTTEGEAYAMFFALVTNDQMRFKALLDWTEANMAQGDLTAHLPAWSWGQASDGSWHALDTNSAADADLWMAYSLCEAGRLWKIKKYEELGMMIERMVAEQETALVPGVGTVLLPGPEGFHPSDSAWYMNPSYAPPFILAYFAHRDADSPWGQVLMSLPVVTKTSGGFAMDWMLDTQTDGLMPSPPPGVVAALTQGQAAPTPVGGFDAIRVYLWAGLSDPATPHVQDLLANLRGMAAYMNTHTAPPQQVGPEGQVLNPDGPAGFSAALIPYLDAVGQPNSKKAQIDRLDVLKDPSTGLYGKGQTYYDQNLALFEDGWSSGRFHFNKEGELVVKWKH